MGGDEKRSVQELRVGRGWLLERNSLFLFYRDAIDYLGCAGGSCRERQVQARSLFRFSYAKLLSLLGRRFFRRYNVLFRTHVFSISFMQHVTCDLPRILLVIDA